MRSPHRSRQRLFVSVARGHRWAAWLEDARVVEFHHQRDDDDEEVAGNIYLGRIVRVDKGLGAAFVDIGRQQTAFFPLGDSPGPVTEGARAVVQIERAARGDKGPRVTGRPVIVGVRLILRPGRRGVAVSERIADKVERSRLSAAAKTFVADEGVVVRTSAAGASDDQLRDEALVLRAQWQTLVNGQRASQPPVLLYREPGIDLRLLRDNGRQFDEIVYDSRNAAQTAAAWCQGLLPEAESRIEYSRRAAWDPSGTEILDQVQDALEPRVKLPSGGSIFVQFTEAMTVVDVNAGSAGGAQADVTGDQAALRTNLAAADEIARQLRLRNAGGIVVIDFIDLKDGAGRRRVLDRLRAAVAYDSAPVWIGAMSRLGLVELTRQRRGPTLAESMAVRCATCDGTGFVRCDLGHLRMTDET